MSCYFHGHGGVTLATYRLYRLDGAGKISTAEWIDASDDEDAVEQTRQRGDGGTWEVWDRRRLVMRITPRISAEPER
jgi:hypothetical protein